MQNRIIALATATLVGVTAAASHGAIAYALTDENVLIGFDTATPSMPFSASILRTAANQPIQDLIGIDYRPATNVLYGVGKFGAIYTIDPTTGVSASSANLSVFLSGSRFGFDFNPVPDRLRIVSDSDQNLRVNVDTGATTVDLPINFTGGGNPNVIASAYTNVDVNPATSTTLYSIDSVTNLLYIQNPPNDGTQVLVGSLGIDVTNISGFDINTVNGVNTAFAALQTTSNPASTLYSINLTTGLASPINVIGGGDRIDGLAVVPAPIPEPTALAAIAGGLLVAGVRRRRGQA